MYEEKLVICEHHKRCPEALYCGGAKPHRECSECGKCPFDPTAKCVPYKENIN